MNIEVIPLESENLKPALKLVNDTFMRFVADKYSEEGIINFKKFIDYGNMFIKLINGNINFYYCYNKSKITGVIAVRENSHICLLFVDSEYQNKSVGTALFKYACAECVKNHALLKEITVNASPNAVEFYKKLKFVPTEDEKCEDGILFTPMKYKI